MPTATKRVVAFLAVFAAFVVILNIYRWISPAPPPEIPIIQTIPSVSPIISITPTPASLVYNSGQCGIALSYPSDFTFNEDASGSAILASPDQKNAIFITCNPEEKLPGQYVTGSESMQVASVSARLYHQIIDGQELETLVLRHPKINRRIFVAGNGKVFSIAVSTIQFIE